MYIEPVLAFIRWLRIPWWALWLSYAGLDIVLTLALVWTSGKTKVRMYFEDKLSIVWPLLVLGPSAALYLIIADLGDAMSVEISTLSGLTPFKGDSPEFIITSSLVILLIVVGVEAYSQRRFQRIRPSSWFLSPWYLRLTRMVLFNLPLGYLIGQFVIRLIIQWIALTNFLAAPGVVFSPFFFHSDGFFGLTGVRDIFFQEALLVVLASFLPTPMLIRESRNKHAWQYKALFITAMILSVGWILVIGSLFNSLLESIHGAALAQFAGRDMTSQTIQDLLSYLTDLKRLEILRSIPDKLVWPVGLAGIAVFRTITFVLEIYGTIKPHVDLSRFGSVRSWLSG